MTSSPRRKSSASRATAGKKATGERSTAERRKLRARAKRVVAHLSKEFPSPRCALDHETPLQLLVATILSAQCTDERVNMVTPALFAAYPDAKSLAEAPSEKVEALIRSTGFFRNKTKNIQGAAARIETEHGGRVPDTMEELLALPGVARKTANVVLGVCFRRAEGVVVDTHVGRISRLLGLTTEKDPVKVERDLMDLLPREEWIDFSHRLILHGRKTCIANRPRCEVCVLRKICPSSTAPAGRNGTGATPRRPAEGAARRARRRK